MCASCIGGAAGGPMVPAEYSIASVGVLLPILSLSFFPSLPGNLSSSSAEFEVPLAQTQRITKEEP